jgi:hypothetical protein
MGPRRGLYMRVLLAPYQFSTPVPDVNNQRQELEGACRRLRCLVMVS